MKDKLQKKRAVIVLCLVLVLFSLLFVWFFFGRIAYPDSFQLAPQGVEVSADAITIDAFYGSSALFNFSGYELSYTDGILFVRFRGGFPLPGIPDKSNTVYYPIPNKYPDLRRIYLRGYPWQEDRLIWVSIGDLPL